MTYEDIFARLLEGEKADDIADELADMLNKAQAEVRVQKEKERQEKEAQERAETARVERENKLNELAAQMAKILDEYVRIYAPDLFTEAEKDGDSVSTVSAKEVREIADSVFDTLDHLKHIQIKTHIPKDLKNLDDIFTAFFKDMGI